MSISEDRLEQERLDRQAAIKAALEEADSKAEPKEEAKAVAPALYPPLRPWEKLVKGRREQYRPMTAAEIEAEAERAFLKKQWTADQAHGEKVREAIKEQAAEQKRLDKKRENERVTGKRPMGKDTISLEEARARGLIGSGSSSSSNGKPEWWSPGNPDGIMGGGR